MSAEIIDKNSKFEFQGVVKGMIQKGSVLVNIGADESDELFSFELNSSNDLWICVNLQVSSLLCPDTECNREKRAAVWFDVYSGKALGCCVGGLVDSLMINCSLKRSIEKYGIPKYVSLDFVKYFKPENCNDSLFQKTFSQKQIANHKFLFELIGIEIIDFPIFLYTKTINRIQNFIDYVVFYTLHCDKKEKNNYKKIIENGDSEIRIILQDFIEKYNKSSNKNLPENLSPADLYNRDLKESRKIDTENLNCLLLWFYTSLKGRNNALTFYCVKIKDYKIHIKEINKTYQCGIKNNNNVLVGQVFNDEPEKIYLFDIAGGFVCDGTLVNAIIFEGQYKNYENGKSKRHVVSIEDAAKLEKISIRGMNKRIIKKQIKCIAIDKPIINRFTPRGLDVKDLSPDAQRRYFLVNEDKK